jgi:hypothetical protein
MTRDTDITPDPKDTMSNDEPRGCDVNSKRSTIHLSFQHLPGHPRVTTEDGPPWVPTSITGSAFAGDDEALGDAAMSLVDYAMDECPSSFPTGGYGALNGESIALAESICAAVDRDHAEAYGGRWRKNSWLWPRWFEDVEIGTGVVVRLDCFEAHV